MHSCVEMLRLDSSKFEQNVKAFIFSFLISTTQKTLELLRGS